VIFLSGAQYDILRHTPSDRPKYAGVGFAILFTGVMACVSMCFALHTALRVDLILALITGLLWGCLIMGIDRMLVVSMRTRRGWRNLFLVIIPRLLLGLLLSIVITTPVVLEIFRPEIDQKLTTLHDEQLAASEQQQSSSPLGKDIAKLRADIKTLSAEISQPPGLAKMQTQYAAAEAAVSAANAEYQCQLRGGPGCVAGDGPKAETAKGTYQSEQAIAGQLHDQIQSLLKRIPTLQNQLDQDQSQLDSDLSLQLGEETAAHQASIADSGLLIRLQALGQVTAHNGTLQAARILLFLLFTLFECMPIVSKVLLLAAGNKTYGQALAADELVQVQVAAKMSADKLTAADSLIAERNRIRAQPSWTAVPREPRFRFPRYRPTGEQVPAAWRRRDRPRPEPAAMRSRRVRAEQPRPPRVLPRLRRQSRGFPSWSSFPLGGQDGSRLPPVFLREPGPARVNGQDGGTRP